ncbi:hypothetical protein ABTO25_20690, partial [Acinetobacter baumannii]
RVILVLLLRVHTAHVDVRLAMGIIGVLAVFLGMLPFARIVYRTASPETSPAGVAKQTVRTSCAH